MYELEAWGEKEKVKLFKEKYYDGNLAIRIDYFDEDMQGWLPYANLTVNLNCRLNDGCAYVDVNNCPWAREFIEKYNLGVYTGKVCHSGFCVYPLYKFNLDKLS